MNLKNPQKTTKPKLTLLWDNSNILFHNSQILNFSLGPFKAQLHFILKTANHFQHSYSIPFTSLCCFPKRQEKKKSSKPSWTEKSEISSSPSFQMEQFAKSYFVLSTNRHFPGAEERIGTEGSIRCDILWWGFITSKAQDTKCSFPLEQREGTAAGTTTSAERLWHRDERCSVRHAKCPRTKLQRQG